MKHKTNSRKILPTFLHISANATAAKSDDLVSEDVVLRRKLTIFLDEI